MRPRNFFRPRQVIGYDPIVSAEAAQEFDVEKRELDAIWADADYITVHTPLIPQTKREIFRLCSLRQFLAQDPRYLEPGPCETNVMHDARADILKCWRVGYRAWFWAQNPLKEHSHT